MGSACGGGSVAIVDDEQSLIDIYQRILETKGIEVCFVAYDGLDAVNKFIEHNPRPGIILMDYRMPGTDGVEATKRILSLDSGVKIIFVSADESVREEAMRAGAVAFVQKPASIKEILNAVESVASK